MNSSLPPLVLTADELQSALWMRIEAHYTARLQQLREENDGVLPADHTDRLRGEIRAIKNLLALRPKPMDLREVTESESPLSY